MKNNRHGLGTSNFMDIVDERLIMIPADSHIYERRSRKCSMTGINLGHFADEKHSPSWTVLVVLDAPFSNRPTASVVK